MNEKSKYEQMKSDTERIKQLNLLEVAESMGYTFHKKGHTYECNEENGLIYFPNTNTYFHFYNNTGGSVIDFVMNCREITFPEAVKSLSDYMNGNGYDYFLQNSVPAPAKERDTAAPKTPTESSLVLPEANEDYKRAFAYLSKSRGIAPDIISRMMHEKKIYEEKAHHNVVFVGYDAEGIPKHAFIRGTITGKQFRGDTAGSDKNYGFSVTGKNNNLIVFEAPIDLLSYMTIFPNTNCHLLALGMLASHPVDTYISEHPEIKNIGFILDNDEPGKEAAEKFEQEFTDKGIGIIKTNFRDKLDSSPCKDVNDYLIYLKQELSKEPEVKKHGRVIR